METDRKNAGGYVKHQKRHDYSQRLAAIEKIYFSRRLCLIVRKNFPDTRKTFAATNGFPLSDR